MPVFDTFVLASCPVERMAALAIVRRSLRSWDEHALLQSSNIIINYASPLIQIPKRVNIRRLIQDIEGHHDKKC